MDGSQFDNLTRVIGRGFTSRRGLLRSIAGAAFALGLVDRRKAPAIATHCPGNTTECGGGRPGRPAPCCPSGYSCCPLESGDEVCCYDELEYCDADRCGCLSIGSTCCVGADGGRTACPPDYFCCPLDSGNQTCCALEREICDPTFTCRLASSCPSTRVVCGNVCCRTGESCDPVSNACTTCPTGRQCSDGTCLSSGCCAGETECADGSCIDTGCCPDQRHCSDGSCITTGCCAGEIECADGSCVDTASDPLNCGGCMNACPTGTFCQSGQCVCEVSLQPPCGKACCVPTTEVCRGTQGQLPQCVRAPGKPEHVPPGGPPSP